MTMQIYQAVGRGNKIVWLDASVQVVTDTNRTTELDWTDLDLTANTSADAKFAILWLVQILDSYTSGGVWVGVRKNGTTPSYFPYAQCGPLGTGEEGRTLCWVACDSGQVIEYKIRIAGTAQVDSYINLLGYAE